MSLDVEVKYDRVGSVYRAGENVTGVVVIRNPSSFSHSGITLVVEGTVALYASPRGLGSFDTFYSVVKPVVLFSAHITLSASGKLPEGEVEMPFSFDLVPDLRKQPLLETYQGVYINCTYSATASISKMVGKKVSSPATMYVYCPGQAMPAKSLIEADKGVPFTLTTEKLRAARKFNGDVIPEFNIVGQFDRELNDIDVPLSGWIMIKACSVRVTSLELQLIRAEYCATADNAAREATEIQNIQIGDGDVMKGFPIPIYMFFPRWYTCAVLKTLNYKVAFEINLVVTLEDQNQITQNLPIRLYRGLS